MRERETERQIQKRSSIMIMEIRDHWYVNIAIQTEPTSKCWSLNTEWFLNSPNNFHLSKYAVHTLKFSFRNQAGATSKSMCIFCVWLSTKMMEKSWKLKNLTWWPQSMFTLTDADPADQYWPLLSQICKISEQHRLA